MARRLADPPGPANPKLAQAASALLLAHGAGISLARLARHARVRTQELRFAALRRGGDLLRRLARLDPAVEQTQPVHRVRPGAALAVQHPGDHVEAVET